MNKISYFNGINLEIITVGVLLLNIRLYIFNSLFEGKEYGILYG